MRSLTRTGRIVLVIMLATCIGLGVYVMTLYARFPGRQTPGEAAGSAAGPEPDRGSRIAVTARGRLEPESEVIAVGALPDGRIDQITVTEGEQVDAGDIVAYLDNHREREEERDYQKELLSEARIRLDAETRRGTSLIHEAEVRIRILEQVTPLEVQEQQYQIDGIAAELTRARTDLARLTKLRQDGVATEEQLDHIMREEEQDEARLKNAQATLQRLQTERSLTLEMAREQLKTAQADLSRSQSLVPVGSLEAGVKLAAARLERSVIRAPIDGQILKIFAHAGESTGQGPILKMGNTAQMFTVAEVYETDVRLVRVGQKARITSPALTRELTGTVERLGKSVYKTTVLDIDPAADTDSRIVEVRIKLDQSEPATAWTNLQVRVDIDIH